MIHALNLSATILASGSSDGDGVSLGWLLLLAGFVFYGYVFFRYRNADKRHLHESETNASMHDIQVADQRAGRQRGLRNSRMRGANNRSVKGAQQALGRTGITQDAISNAMGSIFKR